MKKILYGISALIIIALIALLAAPSFIDWTKYRAEITQKVKDATGREITIGGDIIFSILPSPILKIGDIRFSNHQGSENQDMVTMRQLDVEVSFMPLLAGNIHISSIRLIEPIIHLEKRADGRVNWDFSKPEEDEQALDVAVQAGNPAFVDTAPTEETPLPLQIDDFIIQNGEIFYDDKTTQTSEHVKELNSRFSLAGLNGPFEAAGTLNVHNIPVGFEGTVGKIIHGRTASFNSEIKLAHGETVSRISGTFINLPDGPKLNTKIDVSGQSLAGLISALDADKPLPGGLNRAFSAKGEISYNANILSLGNGFDITLGDDRATLLIDVEQGAKTNISINANVNKIDGDIWLNSPNYTPVAPAPLTPVITPTDKLMKSSGGRISATLSGNTASTNKTSTQSAANEPFNLPTDINADVSVGINAVMIKGEPIRQIQVQAALKNGELVLENASAILPGAGEVALIGAADNSSGQFVFDGSLDTRFTHLRGAMKWLNIQMDQIPTDRLQQLKLSTKFQATAENIQLYDFLTQVDGSNLTGGATIALRSRPSFGLSLSLDRLNVDAYLPKQEKEETSSSSTSSEQPKQQASSPQTNMAKGAASFVSSFDLLKTFDANVILGAKHITYEGRDIRNIELESTIFNGALDIKKLSIGDFAGLNATVSGGLSRNDSALLADNLSVSLKSQNLKRVAPLLGINKAANWNKIGPISVNGALNGNLLAPDIDLTLNALGSSAIIAASTDLFPTLKADASVNLSSADLRKITSALDIDYKPAGKAGPLKLSTDINWTPSATKINNLSGNIAQTPFTGSGQFTQSSRNKLTLNLETGTFVLDPFLPAQAKQKSAANNNHRNAKKQNQSTSQATDWPSDPLDTSALKNMDADINVKMAGLSHKGKVFKQIGLKATLDKGVLQSNLNIANLFGGSLQSSTTANAQSVLQTQTNVTANNLQLAPLLSYTSGKASAAGAISLTTNLSSTGNNQKALISNLSGPLNLKASKISVQKSGKGSSPLDLLNLLVALSGGDPKKGLADVNLQTSIENGVIRLGQNALTSPIANGQAQGYVDLPNWMLDVSGTLKMQQNALLGLIAREAKMKSDYPFSFKGSIDNPDIKLDTGGISSGGGLVIPIPSKLEKKGYGNLIRGLLGQPQQQPSQPTQNNDGTIAPPPPPSGQSNNNGKISKEELILEGLGAILGR